MPHDLLKWYISWFKVFFNYHWCPEVSTLNVSNSAIFNKDFSMLLHTTWIIWKFQDFLIDCEIWRPNRETVSWYPKPWVSQSNCESWQVCTSLSCWNISKLPVPANSMHANQCCLWHHKSERLIKNLDPTLKLSLAEVLTCGSRNGTWSFIWTWQVVRSLVPSRGITCTTGNLIYICTKNGLKTKIPAFQPTFTRNWACKHLQKVRKHKETGTLQNSGNNLGPVVPRPIKLILG